MVATIKSHKDNCGKFSFTSDEWSSLRNWRCLNMDIHFNKKYINLRLVRILESCTADKTVKLVNLKLTDFGINLSDVVASTTDAAATMVKFAGLSEFIHQLCYNHYIHLAVVDVIYETIKNYKVIVILLKMNITQLVMNFLNLILMMNHVRIQVSQSEQV